MAKRIFKNMTPAQRVEARKEARLNKNKPPAPAPRFADTDRGRSAAASTREAGVVPRGYQLTPEQQATQAATEAAGKNNFEDIFLSIIQFLPPDQQGRAFSLFSVFRQQSPEEQKAVVDSLMNVAREQTGPLFDLYQKRIEEDATYRKAALTRQSSNAKENFDKLVQTVDTNALRDKAKTDRSMAKVIRSITNTAFVDRVAGSGIQRRRTQEQLEEAALVKGDVDLKASQTKSAADIQYNQIKKGVEDQLAREDVLKERDLYGNEQSQEEAERSLFLSLFENQYANAGDNARDNIESGDIDPTTGLPGTDITAVGGKNASNIRATDNTQADVLASGGTDAERRKRYREAERFLRMTPEEILNEKFDPETLAKLQKVIGYGNPVGEIDGRVTFANNPRASSEIGVQDYEQNYAENIQLYNDILSGNYQSGIRNSISSRTTPVATTSAVATPVPTAPLIPAPTVPTYTPTPITAPVLSTAQRAKQQYNDPNSPLYVQPVTAPAPSQVVVNPNTGQAYTGGAASRLAKRLAR